MARKFSMGFFGVLIFAPFDHPRHGNPEYPWVVLLTPLKDQNMLLKMILGSKGWHSGESACLPPM